MKYENMTYNKLAAAFKKGDLDPYDALEFYQKSRRTAMKQLNIIQKSDIPFERPPEFVKPSKIHSTDELLHAIADVNRFRRLPSYTKKGREEARDKAIETLRAHGIDFVDKSNYKQYATFMRWFYENNLNKIYGSQEDVIEDFFREQWDRVSGYKSNKAKKAALTKFINNWD